MPRVVLARRPEAESAGVLLSVVGEVVEGHGVGLVGVVPAYVRMRDQNSNRVVLALKNIEKVCSAS